MTQLITDKPSSRPVTAETVLDYLNREAGKAIAALISRVNQLITRAEYVYEVESAAAVNVDWGANDMAVLTLDQNTTINFVDPFATAGLLRLVIHQPAAFTVTWPADVVWPGGVAPAITGPSTAVLLQFYGGVYYGFA